MKKTLFGLAALLLGSVLLLAGLGRHGFHLGGMNLSWSATGAELEDLATSFLEDVQFKDFEKAASYHTWDDRQDADVPRLIERLFKVKPEQLNLRDIRITDVDLDRGGNRARTFFSATTELLNSGDKSKDEQNKEKQVEGVLYWHRLPSARATDPAVQTTEPSPAQTWFLMLESSLR